MDEHESSDSASNKDADMDEQEDGEDEKEKVDDPERIVGTFAKAFYDKKLLSKELQTFQSHGSASEDLADLNNPGLILDGSIFVYLPMTEAHLHELISKKIVSQAPFGRGQETILDPTVRRTWQVDPAKVNFANPNTWPCIRKLTNRACAVLGMDTSRQDISVVLHKLLIYAPGDHFKPHRDSVHSKGQFATLVLQLPSIFTGGLLRIWSGTDEVQIDQSEASSCYQSKWSLFYANCLHEVTEIQSGYRVCLTFDVCSSNLAPPTQDTSSSVQYKSYVETLHKLLEQWYDRPSIKPSRQDRLKTSKTESWEVCDCGHTYLRPSKVEDEDSSAEDDDDCDEDDFNFRRTSAPFALLVLDHQLPKNELQTLVNSGGNLVNHLGLIRGIDRTRVQGALAAIARLPATKSFETQMVLCEYVRDNAGKGFKIDCNCALALDVCNCSVFVEDFNHARQLYFFSGDTGNEGEVEETAYETCALLLAPCDRSNDILFAALVKDRKNFSKIQFQALSREAQESIFLDFFSRKAISAGEGYDRSSIATIARENVSVAHLANVFTWDRLFSAELLKCFHNNGFVHKGAQCSCLSVLATRSSDAAKCTEFIISILLCQSEPSAWENVVPEIAHEIKRIALCQYATRDFNQFSDATKHWAVELASTTAFYNEFVTYCEQQFGSKTWFDIFEQVLAKKSGFDPQSEQYMVDIFVSALQKEIKDAPSETKDRSYDFSRIAGDFVVSASQPGHRWYKQAIQCADIITTDFSVLFWTVKDLVKNSASGGEPFTVVVQPLFEQFLQQLAVGVETWYFTCSGVDLSSLPKTIVDFIKSKNEMVSINASDLPRDFNFDLPSVKICLSFYDVKFYRNDRNKTVELTRIRGRTSPIYQFIRGPLSYRSLVKEALELKPAVEKVLETATFV